MSKEKKLIIAIVVFAVMFLVSIFGLSLISNMFLVVGIYCGFNVLLLTNVLLDLKTGKRTNIIIIGLLMTIIGCALLKSSEAFDQIVCIPISAMYVIVGIYFFVKGIKRWLVEKRKDTLKEKKPMNKKIYIGILLLVLGWILTFVLFNVQPMLMVIGHIIIFIGFFILVSGLAKKKDASSDNSVTYDHYNGVGNTSSQLTPVYCDYCRKNITYLKKIKIDGNIYCSDCEKAIEQNTKNQHIVCEICGVDLSIENMHVINDITMCHACFLKKYGEFDY